MFVYFFIFDFTDRSATCAYRVMALFGDTFQPVLYIRRSERKAYDNVGVQQQFNRIINRSAAYVEMIFIFELLPDHIRCKKSFYPAYLFKNSIPFGGVSEIPAFQIFGKRFP
jgi:hypothetical protein